MRVIDIADAVEFCTLARDLTGAPNWVKQSTTVVVTRTLTERPAVESQTLTSFRAKRVWINQLVDRISTTLTKCLKKCDERSDASLSDAYCGTQVTTSTNSFSDDSAQPEGASRHTTAHSKARTSEAGRASWHCNKTSDDSARPEGASRHTTAHPKARTSQAGCASCHYNKNFRRQRTARGCESTRDSAPQCSHESGRSCLMAPEFLSHCRWQSLTSVTRLQKLPNIVETAHLN